MNTFHWLLIGSLALAFLLILWVILRKPELGAGQCYLHNSLCDMEWRKFWLSLQQAVTSKQLALSWVPLAKLVRTDGTTPDFAEWLQQRWVDFVVLDQGGYMPLAVIQFERHDDEDPMWKEGRDPLLSDILNQVNLPLLWLPGPDYQDSELIRHALEQLWARQAVAATDLGNTKTYPQVSEWTD